MSQRTSGILLHPSSLCNAYQIGDLGTSAIAFVDFLVEAGQHWWQMLPIGPTGGGNSPYQSSSAFAGNPLLVSPERLIKQRYLSLQDITAPILSVSGSVNFIEAGQWKVSLLVAFCTFLSPYAARARASIIASRISSLIAP